MQNATTSNPPINDSMDSAQGDYTWQSDAAEDKAMPSQSGGTLSNDDEDYSEVAGNKFQKNKINKYGGKPKGDESITNRGVTKADPDKDKAI